MKAIWVKIEFEIQIRKNHQFLFLGPPSADSKGQKRSPLNIRPTIKSNCFYVVASCQTKVHHGDWDKLDCEDGRTKDCCEYECTRKYQLIRKAEREAKLKIEKEARESISQLEMLESQKAAILSQLEEAKAKVVKISRPQESIEDLSAIAALPERPNEELETLVKVADAVLNTKVDLDPKVKEDLEDTIMENIIEIAEENKAREESSEEQGLHFISEEAEYEDMQDFVVTTEAVTDNVQEFLDENDIMQSDDPFSLFLKSQM